MTVMQHLRLCAALALMTPSALVAESTMPDWMTGAWAMNNGESWADEFWTPPRAGIMIGAGRAGEGDKLQFWEHMRIVREADGKLAFWAIAGKQQPVRFFEAKMTTNEVVFENPLHDYPQRIRYWREGNELEAQTSLLDGSKPNDFSFRMMGQ
jgi:hypothetical protein